MDSRLRVGGHAVHPLLLLFPLGLFAMASIMDAGVLLGAPSLLAVDAHLTILAGLVGGASALAAGWYDALSAPRGAEFRAGFLVVLLDMGELVLFAVIAVIRLRTTGRASDPTLFAVQAFGLVLAAVGAWYAGRLGGRRAPSQFAGESDF